MPVPSAITDLSQTAGSNSPAGSESPALLDDYIRTVFAFIAKLRDGQGLSAPVDLASAATTDIGAQTSPIVRITGTTTITSFGSNYSGPRFLTFAGALTLTHNATSLILPGGANITTAAGDACIAVPNLATPSGWRVIAYQKANGAAVLSDLSAVTGILAYANGGTGQTTPAGIQSILPIQQARVDVASAATVNLTSSVPSNDHINITGTTTITAFTVAAGRTMFVRFAGSLTLTNNASIVTQSGANITTQAGDTCILRATAANVVEVLAYVRGIPQALGDGQTWQDVSGSRSSGTTYTNTTGRTIAVLINPGTGATTTYNISGTTFNNTLSGGGNNAVTFLVPPGATYSAASLGGGYKWLELR